MSCEGGCKEIRTSTVIVDLCKDCDRLIGSRRFDFDIVSEAIKLLEYTAENMKPTVIKRDNELIKKRILKFLENIK